MLVHKSVVTLAKTKNNQTKRVTVPAQASRKSTSDEPDQSLRSSSYCQETKASFLVTSPSLGRQPNKHHCWDNNWEAALNQTHSNEKDPIDQADIWDTKVTKWQKARLAPLPLLLWTIEWALRVRERPEVAADHRVGPEALRLRTESSAVLRSPRHLRQPKRAFIQLSWDSNRKRCQPHFPSLWSLPRPRISRSAISDSGLAGVSQIRFPHRLRARNELHCGLSTVALCRGDNFLVIRFADWRLLDAWNFQTPDSRPLYARWHLGAPYGATLAEAVLAYAWVPHTCWDVRFRLDLRTVHEHNSE